jgi:hypothetical protein
MNRAQTVEDACADRLGPLDLMMRIVAAPRTMRDPEVLGFSYIDIESRRTLLGTVFADRTSAVARRLGVKDGTLLGRAIAHEIGHLLLGSTHHPVTGLMRDRWSTRPGDSEDWLFSIGEAANMRTALAVRQDQAAGRSVPVTSIEARSPRPQ